MNSCIRLSNLMNVDFPHPDGPMRPVTVRAGNRNDMSRKAWCLPNHACAERVSSPANSADWAALEAMLVSVLVIMVPFADTSFFTLDSLGMGHLLSFPPMRRAIVNSTSTMASSTSEPDQARAIAYSVPICR